MRLFLFVSFYYTTFSFTGVFGKHLYVVWFRWVWFSGARILPGRGWIGGPVEIPGRVLARVLSRLFRSRTSDKIFRKRETSRPRREGPIGFSQWEAFPVLNILWQFLTALKKFSTIWRTAWLRQQPGGVSRSGSGSVCCIRSRFKVWAAIWAA